MFSVQRHIRQDKNLTGEAVAVKKPKALKLKTSTDSLKLKP